MHNTSPKMNTIRVVFSPLGRRIEIEAGQSLLEAAQAAGVELLAVCGGAGVCGSCRIRVVEGRITEITSEETIELEPEDISHGFRLACRAVPLSDCHIDVPPESLAAPQRLQLEGQADEIQTASPVVALDVQAPAPSVYDLRSDLDRLVAAVEQAGGINGRPMRVGLAVLSDLSEKLRASAWHARLALRQDELIAVLPIMPGAPAPAFYGVAVDVGTTKLAAYLVDMDTGKTVAQTGAMNPQVSYGEDVISRIHYCNEHPGGRQVLQSRLVETLNQMVEEMCNQAGVSSAQIVEAVAAGNTAMHHLLVGLPVTQLGTSPYVPAVSGALEIEAGDIGLSLASGAKLYLPPNIAGYVGADHVAALLASLGEPSQWGLDLSPESTVVLVDIGTNTEISLLRGEGIWSCSTASGPAFEGAHIQDGMRAAPGAIERVQINHGQVSVYTIGERPPVGICGSGILDTVACLLDAGAINPQGNLICPPDMLDEKRQFVLVPSQHTGHGRKIALSRKDINEVQLAKGAIRTGIDLLLEAACLEPDQVDRFIVAGAFGTYLDLRSAVRVGMFPDLPLEKFHQVGNAAGAGARQMLISVHKRLAAAEIARRVEYIELTAHPKFTDSFTRAIMFEG